MTEFNVQVATAQDEKAVSFLLNASYGELLPDHYPTELLATALPHMTKANPALLVSGTYYLAKAVDGKVIGCGGWTLNEPGTRKIDNGLAHIRHFATHPAWARKGVGTALMTRCSSDAENRGVQAIKCFSTLNAERFYAAAGFERIHAVDVPLTPEIGFPAILMVRDLAND
jgi:GNAT superfamily N-acetyltransferase